jgi:hypothetical protein
MPLTGVVWVGGVTIMTSPVRSPEEDVDGALEAVL